MGAGQVSDLADIFLSAQSIRMSEVMKVLTVIATVFMPLTLISSIYGMNFDTKASAWNMPELGWAFGYPMILVFMVAISMAMLAYFKHRGWIGKSRRRSLGRRKSRTRKS
jgi:magnesium transporter